MGVPTPQCLKTQLLSSPALDVRLLTALQVLQVLQPSTGSCGPDAIPGSSNDQDQ